MMNNEKIKTIVKRRLKIVDESVKFALNHIKFSNTSFNNFVEDFIGTVVDEFIFRMSYYFDTRFDDYVADLYDIISDYVRSKYMDKLRDVDYAPNDDYSYELDLNENNIITEDLDYEEAKSKVLRRIKILDNSIIVMLDEFSLYTDDFVNFDEFYEMFLNNMMLEFTYHEGMSFYEDDVTVRKVIDQYIRKKYWTQINDFYLFGGNYKFEESINENVLLESRDVTSAIKRRLSDLDDSIEFTYEWFNFAEANSFDKALDKFVDYVVYEFVGKTKLHHLLIIPNEEEFNDEDRYEVNDAVRDFIYKYLESTDGIEQLKIDYDEYVEYEKDITEQLSPKIKRKVRRLI